MIIMHKAMIVHDMSLPPLEREQGRGLQTTPAGQHPLAHPHLHYHSQPTMVL